MAVTIVQKTKEPAEVAGPSVKSELESELKARVDAAGVAHDHVEAAKIALKDAEAKYKEAQKALQDQVDVLEPEDMLHLSGEDWELEISAGAKERKVVNKGKLVLFLNKVKKGLFEELASVTLTNIDKYLTPDQIEQCVHEGRGKKRNWKFAYKGK